MAIRQFFQRQGGYVLDLALLEAALLLTGRFVPGAVLYFEAHGIALAVAGFATLQKPAASGARRWLGLLSGKLLAIAIGSALLLFWLAVPRPGLWFGPIWLGLTVAARAGWRLLHLALKLNWRAAGAALRQACARIYGAFRARRFDRPLGGAALAGAAWWISRELVTPGTGRGELAAALWTAAALAAYARLAFRRLDCGENLRWLALASAGFWLLHPFVTRSQHGTDDARWYATMLADMVAQVRAGFFPVWTGQSIWQFNGSIFPFRLAPAYHYLGALLDIFTLRSLEPFALQHLLLIAAGVIGIFSTYRCLTRLLPRHRWVACALACCWLACPGVAGVVFNTDLYMTWTTLPAVAWVALGWVRIWREEDERAGWWNIALGLGWTWWGHTPIALWLSLCTAGVAAAWLAVRRPRPAQLLPAVRAGAVCGLLALFPLISYLTAIRSVGAGPEDFAHTPANDVAGFIGSVFPAVLRPLSAKGRTLSDFQLGWSLWLVLGGMAWQGVRRRRPELGCLLAVAAYLVLLVTPLPGINLLLWKAMPEMVRSADGLWAMNRLYLILASVTVVGAAAALRAREESGPFRPPAWGVIVAGLALAWSAREAGKYIHGSNSFYREPETGSMAMLPENASVTRNAYFVFPRHPSYYSEGVVNPELENRILSEAGDRVLVANEDAAAAQGTVAMEGSFDAIDPAAVLFLKLNRPVVLEPGKHYLLEFTFLHPDVPGVLQVVGGRVFREYALPDYGDAESFGMGGRHSRYLALWTSEAAAQTVRLRFTPSDQARLPHLAPWARVRLLAYDPAALPVSVESWTPFQARVRAPGPAWLETPRMYQLGYRATVDGAEAEVRRSPQALAMVRVPAGSSQVVLRYPGSWLQRGAFWLSFGGWLACLALAGRRLRWTE